MPYNEGFSVAQQIISVGHVCHNRSMSKRPGEKRDFMQVARDVVEQAIGEHMDGSPLEAPPPDLRSPKAVSRGRKGGKTGGKARAAKLTSAERTAIARKGAIARWKK